MRSDGPTTIKLTVAPRWLPIFGSLLSQGFAVTVQTGVSLKTVLCDQLGIETAYLEDRIQTVFLNGHPVDDVSRAVVEDGAVVAISAAMPGLVGAVMRRGGFYAGLRSGISYRADSGTTAVVPGTIRLKLFNLVAKELGAYFLARGVRIESRIWKAFMESQPEDFRRGIRQVRIEGKRHTAAELYTRQWPSGDVQLVVTAD